MDDRIRQAMRPTGLKGRAFGFLMERFSARNYAWVVAQLAPLRPESYLEIGFGTGKLAEVVARKFAPHRLVGIDPSTLMVETARKKLRRFAQKHDVDLRHGDDALLEQIEGPFDAIAAAHSFQFWREPAKTLARIHALLAPNGRFALVLKSHAAGKTHSWLPNPISKSGDEIGGARKALADAGFGIGADEMLKTGSQGILAVRA